MEPIDSLALAQDEQTPPDVLRELSKTSSPTVLEHIALNPNAPTEVLVRLGQRFPDALMENPVLPLLLIENPRLFADMTDETALRLIHHPKADETLWILASLGRTKVRLALTGLKHAPLSLLEKLAQDKNPQIRLSASLHTSLAPGLEPNWEAQADQYLRQYLRSITPSTWEGDLFRLCLRYNPLPTFLFEVLTEHGQEYVRIALAQNPYLPADLQARLAADKSETVRKRIELQRNGYQGFRATVNESVWERALGGSMAVQLSEEAQTWTPAVLLEKAKETAVEVREQVALHPDTPSEILTKLAKSQEMRIQRAVARNPHTPPALLEEVLSDVRQIEQALAIEDPVMRGVVMNLLARSREAYFNIFYLLQPQTDAFSRMEAKLKADVWLLRYLLARHPASPTAWLIQLSEDPNRYVQAMALKRLKTINESY